VVVLPFRDQGPISVRNWIWDRAIESGAYRHWILDDNITDFRRLHKGCRKPCSPRTALRIAEEFIDRYQNVAVGGLDYMGFARAQSPAFVLNTRVYSCILILNQIPFRWRGKFNADADLCLQVLTAGWCTVLIKAFNCHKMQTMLAKGGNTERYKGLGRLEMAKTLERAWPGIVKVKHKWGRYQHSINWKRFKHPLIRRTDIDWGALPLIDEMGIKHVNA